MLDDFGKEITELDKTTDFTSSVQIILRALLFLVFINDSVLCEAMQTLLFADYLKIIR